MANRILLVEDDEKYASTLIQAIEDQGHDVTYIENPVTAIAKFVKSPYDLVISDCCMKEMDGVKMLTVLKGIKPDLRSIILTAFPEEDIEMEALDISVDRYLSKDKSLNLTMRYIDDILNKEIIVKSVSDDKLISKGENIVIDLHKHEVYKDNELVEVTRKEYDLLVLFLENKGVALSRDTMAEKLWTTDIEDVDLRVIDGHIKRLRSKLGLFSITSVRGYGYKWNE